MRRIVLLLAFMTAAVLLVGGALLVGGEKPAQATMPGENGKIAFVHFPSSSTNAAARGIWTVDPDGSEAAKIPGTTEADVSPAWSPNGAKIAFVRRDSVGRGDIYVMNPDGSGVTRLTESPQGEFQPTWSPDGSKIAFLRSHVYNDGISAYSWQEVWVMNADGSGETRLTNDLRASGTPDWSPDGNKIAFTRINCAANDRDCFGVNYDIWVMNAHGRKETKLTTNPSHDRFPSWSPDGKKIAFDGMVAGGNNFDVFVMNADGSGVSRLTDTTLEEEAPKWAPDGTQLVFQRGVNIYTMNADGSEQVPLTSDTYPNLNREPSWQPLPPTSEQQCKNGGYKDFGFKNQGHCIKVVNAAN